MKKVIFAKYNRNRRPEFQVSTMIIEKDGVRYVEKKPLCSEAVAHIQSFGRNYDALLNTYKQVEFVKPDYEGEGVSFPFITGTSMVEAIDKHLNEPEKMYDDIEKAMNIIFDYNTDRLKDFQVTDRFVEVFGEFPKSTEGLKSFEVSNIDTIFDNFVMQGDKWYCIDFEWVFDFPIPVDYMAFRTLFFYYNKNSMYLDKKVSLEEFLQRFGISGEDCELYMNMEDNFQQYAHGKNREYIYLRNYSKSAPYFQDYIQGMDTEIRKNYEEITQTHHRLHEALVAEGRAREDARDARAQLDKALGDIVEKDKHIETYQAYVARTKRALRNPAYAAYLVGKKVAKKVVPKQIYKDISMFKNEGPIALKYAKAARKHGDNAQYALWIEENEKNIYVTKHLEYKPKISVIVPVYNVADDMLIAMIESVKKQTYKNWELCLVDDKSTMESVRVTLQKYENNPKIKVVYREENGHISKATNSGFEVATGEFVALLDCDDLLAPNALYEMAKKLNENRDYDFIYSDEDKVSEDGKVRRDPFFKPDWSPDTFMSLMYTCHLAMYRKSLIDELGGMRVGLEGSQDYDLVLRVMEKTKNIGHIPKILYHWRMRKESTANALTAKPYIVQATIKAKTDALERRGLKGTLSCIEEVTQYRVTYEPQNNPLISIIIPSKDNYDILCQCIKSIDEVSEYRNYEIIVVDNGSSEENRQRYAELCDTYKCKYIYDKADFNFSKMCNTGAANASGELLLFLNDDIKVMGGKWLEIMAGHAQLDYTGAVGAKLLYPNTNLIQHAGVINYDVGPGHCFAKIDDSLNCYYGRNVVDYNFSIVTGACLMVEAKKFHEIGGFEETLPIAYNDVDLCFKLIEHGYFNVLRNDVKLYHYESISRGADVSVEKAARLKAEAKHLYEMHPGFVGYDPCYNPNLTQDSNDFSYNRYGETSMQEKIEGFTLEGIRNGMDFMEYAIDNVMVFEDSVKVSGWAFYDGIRNNNKLVPKLLLFAEDGTVTAYNTEKMYRIDVDRNFGKHGNISMCGFRCLFPGKDISGTVTLGIEINNAYVLTPFKVKR